MLALSLLEVSQNLYPMQEGCYIWLLELPLETKKIQLEITYNDASRGMNFAFKLFFLEAAAAPTCGLVLHNNEFQPKPQSQPIYRIITLLPYSV